ncbi:5'-methylthioadenosine/S-adenosylhomocysteine nucleosidase family protein, partial [Rhizobium sp. 21-4511-3d]
PPLKTCEGRLKHGSILNGNITLRRVSSQWKSTLNCTNLQIGEHKGLCIKMSRVGLVDAAIIASKAINMFSPKVVAMSGICAGVAGHSEIGTLVAGNFAWEYQAGKWSVDDFKMEPYQVHLHPPVLDELELFVAKDKLGLQFKENTFPDPKTRHHEIVIGPFASGSAVIADPERVKTISEQQRKMAAIDMEMHSIYRACDISAERPAFFGAKCVVDLADHNKGDEHHVNGSIISARFVSAFVHHLLEKRG